MSLAVDIISLIVTVVAIALFIDSAIVSPRSIKQFNKAIDEFRNNKFDHYIIEKSIIDGQVIYAILMENSNKKLEVKYLNYPNSLVERLRRNLLEYYYDIQCNNGETSWDSNTLTLNV